MRSFFQDFDKDDNGNITWCKMHDLVHDLAQFLTKSECTVKHNNGTQFLNSISRIRHLTIVCDYEVGHSADSYDLFTSSVCNAKKLRTLQILYGYKLRIKEAPADLFHRFRCLTVLCLNDIGIENLSGEIENLIHLRYLDLSYNAYLKILPETISNLYNLQTLNLQGCYSLCKLPGEIRRLINLRHLNLRYIDELSHIPQGIGRLTSLKTLSDFIVGGASEGCKISELKDLNLLQGRLSIKGLGRVETVNEAFEMELKQKNLHTLWLDFKPNEEIENELLSKRMEDVLDVLEPHSEVVELEVIDYLGFKLSSWIGSTSILSHMKTLDLYGCINLTKFPAFGQLPSLEVLCIRRAIKVKHIGFEFYSSSLEHVMNRVPFPKLKELRMEEMNNLEVWELQHGCEFLYEVDEEAGGERFNSTTFPKLDKLTIWSELEWELGVIAGSGGEEMIIMPCLHELSIMGLKNWKVLTDVLFKISSLEILEICGEATEFMKYIRHDEIILFPNLKELKLIDMEDMEELKIGFQVMPLLKCLRISNCNKLKAIIKHHGGSLSKLESLQLGGCASLYELPPFPNLKSLCLSKGPIHPSLPEAFATTLQALEVLIIYFGTWTCMPEQVQQLTSLKRLELWDCGELQQRCRKDEGEDWRIISHIPNIRINIKLTL